MKTKSTWLDTNSVCEKIAQNGISYFSDRELLKMAIGDNTTLFSDVLSTDVINVFDSLLDYDNAFSKLSAIDGIDESKAIALASMAEFMRRRVHPDKKAVRNPSSVFEIVRRFYDPDQERFIVIGVNGAGEVSFSKVVTIGLLDKTLIHPREVFADAIKQRCSSIFIAHNHPSGNLEPSSADVMTTSRLIKAGELLGINVLDHIIFSENNFYSFREHDEMN